MLDQVKTYFKERRAIGAWPTKKTGKLTKAGDAKAFEWLLGIHVGLTLSGDEHGLGPAVFMASVRGVEDTLGV